LPSDVLYLVQKVTKRNQMNLLMMKTDTLKYFTLKLIQAIPNMPNPVTETEVNNFLESKLNMQIGTIDITIEHFSILCLKSGPKILSILIHKPLARDVDRILDLTIL
jgi:hypothetical protein